MVIRDRLDARPQIDADARIHGWGDEWRVSKMTRKGLTLQLVHDRTQKLQLTYIEYNTEAQRSDFKYEAEYFRPRCVMERTQTNPISIGQIPKDDQKDVNFKISCIREFYKLHYSDRISRTYKGFARAAELISQKLGLCIDKINWNVDDPAPKPKKRGCRENVAALLKGSTLQRWVEKLEASNWDLYELRDGRYASGNFNKRFSGETYDLLEHYSYEYCKPYKPTREIVYGDFKIAFKALNDRFVAEGRDPDPMPSFSRFCLEIANLDRFEVDVARLGRELAHRKWKLIGVGPDVNYALERVEMDFYKVDLHVLLVKTVIWQQLSPKLRSQIERSSWYLCVALDVASRCVVGMRLSRSESSKTALETLRMIFQDKTAIGRAAGALSPWDQHGSPMGIVLDQGSGFVNAYFQSRTLSLLTDVFHPPAAQPQLRAFIERFFRTVLENLLKRFEGNTGGSVEALGDYPAQVRAVLTIEQFSDLLIRWCVDIYHNKKHAGLGGETPRDAWIRLTGIMQPMPAPDPTRMRISFGIGLTRPTRRTGIRILGLDYNSEELQAYCRSKGDTKVEVKLDPDNIGAVSVRLDPGSTSWITVPCRTHFMEGRRLDDWLLASEELSRRFDDVARMRAPIVLAALDAIARTHREAVTIAEIGDGRHNQKSIDDAESKLGIGFSVPISEDAVDAGSPTSCTTRSGAARIGTTPSTFALLGRGSFSVGGGRVVSGHPLRSVSSNLTVAPEADDPRSGQTSTPSPIPPCVPDRSATPEAEEAWSAPVPDAPEPAGPRRRRTNVKLEK